MAILAKQETTEELKTEYKEELTNLLMKMNSNIERSRLIGSLQTGTYDQADALHNVYADFGYPCQLDFFNFWNMYRRFGPAKAVIRIPPNLSWLITPKIKGSVKFDKELKKLIKTTRLWNRLKGLDIRQRVGRYAGLFIEVKDGKKPEEELTKLNGVASITNLKPLYENQLFVLKTEKDLKSGNYGNPTMYQFMSGVTGSRNKDENSLFNIHPSRVIIAAEDSDDGSIYGVSALEDVFNDLMDLRKISGAGGEGFYQNTRSAPVIEVEKGHSAPSEKQQEALSKEIDDFLSKWQKKFVAKGMKFVYPNIKLDNPKEFAEISWNNISAGTSISTNIFRGVQTGVLAGDKDDKSTMVMIQARRESFVNEMVEDFIDWCIKFGVLPFSEYEITWDDMTASSQSQKLDLAKKMSEVNKNLLGSGQTPAFSEDEIRDISGFEKLDFEIPVETLLDADDADDVDNGE